MSEKEALITGVTGRDGSYLAEFLLEGYEAMELNAAHPLSILNGLTISMKTQISKQNFALHYGDLTNSSNLTRILSDVRPHEVYNLGAQSHVA